MTNPKLKSSLRSSTARKGRHTSQFKTLTAEKLVSDKLQALQSLIPTSGEIDADELFRETADYIILLKTQVSVLQGMIQFYGSVKGTEDCC
ncbi:hypothetical protein QQ045_005644 [Rhodiola kirilowii]